MLIVRVGDLGSSRWLSMIWGLFRLGWRRVGGIRLGRFRGFMIRLIIWRLFCLKCRGFLEVRMLLLVSLSSLKLELLSSTELIRFSLPTLVMYKSITRFRYKAHLWPCLTNNYKSEEAKEP